MKDLSESAQADFRRRWLARLQTAIQRSGLNDRQVSLAADGGQSGKLISRLKSQRNLPRIDTLQSLAIALGVSTDYLCCMPNTEVRLSSTTSGDVYTRASDLVSADFSQLDVSAEGLPPRPSLEAVLGWWRHNNRMLEQTRQILDFCDIYRRPTPEKMYVQPLEVGRLSLAAEELKVNSAYDLEREFRSIPQPAVDSVISWHLKTKDAGSLLSEETLVYTTATGSEVNVGYWRLLLPVIGPDGADDLVLCYARPIDKWRDGP